MADEKDMRWRRHVLGAASLIEARDPERYETDFEKSLLLAQAGPIVSCATSMSVFHEANWD